MNYYKNNIRHVKGDTFSSALVVEGLGQPLDSIFFTCRDSLNDDSNILFEKSLADGGITEVEYDEEHDIRKYAVRIDPYDTRTLQAGTYFYDIQISVNSDVFTIMKGNFILEQDATRKAEPVEPEIIIQIKAALDEINGEEISVNVFDKLDYLSETKGLIEDGLNDLGAEITEETTFRTYASKINDLYDEWPKETEEGTDFSITAKKGKMSLIPKGNTEQDTYTGKNIFNTEFEQGGWRFTDGTAFSSSNYLRNKTKINVEPNTSYTLSYEGPQPTGSAAGYVFYNNGTYVSSLATSSLTFTVPSGADQVSYNLYGINIVPSDVSSIQLEKGNQATSYEPYVGGMPSPNPDYPQEIRVVTGDNTINVNDDSYSLELGTLKAYEDDYFYKNNDSWYIKRLNGEVVLDENSNITVVEIITANNKFIWRYATAINMAGSGARENIKSNYYEGKIGVYGQNDLIGAYVNSNNLINFATLLSTVGATTSSTTSQTLNLLKTWLSNNNVKVLYPLATPTDTLIEDETLIEQLEALNNAMATDGSNTITSEYEEGNAPVIISASALMKGGN